MNTVIVRKTSYEYGYLRPSVFDLLESLDRGLISHGSKVLIKPNLLAPSAPEQAIVTHPLVLKATAEYVLEKGGLVQVSDSNAMGTFNKVANACGLSDALKGMPVTMKGLDTEISVKTSGRFGTLELSEEALDADVLINLPKLKTHSQMALTLAVKNLFGCVVGMKKPEWHYRVGEDKELFAELLVTIYSKLKPQINLIDGILAMEGDGPGTGGKPRHLGMLIGSSDAVSLDMAVCNLVGLKPLALLTNKKAVEMGLAEEAYELGEIEKVKGFLIPDTRDLLFGPRFSRRFLRRHVTGRPENIAGACKYCNECLSICPAGAISNPGRKLNFDYDRCIRCYCCLEVCPHGAMKRKDSLFKKIIDYYYHWQR